MLFNVTWLPDASFVLITAVILIGAAISVRLPELLVTRQPTEHGVGPRLSHE